MRRYSLTLYAHKTFASEMMLEFLTCDRLWRWLCTHTQTYVLLCVLHTLISFSCLYTRPVVVVGKWSRCCYCCCCCCCCCWCCHSTVVWPSYSKVDSIWNRQLWRINWLRNWPSQWVDLSSLPFKGNPPSSTLPLSYVFAPVITSINFFRYSRITEYLDFIGDTVGTTYD